MRDRPSAGCDRRDRSSVGFAALPAPWRMMGAGPGLLVLSVIVTLCGTAAAAAAALPVADALEALKPNQAVLLGKARVAGDINDVARRFRLDVTGPQARDFCVKMAWAQDRKRALFLGANHGSPHRLNDVWEFDLARLTWTLLYAPDIPRDNGSPVGGDFRDVRFRRGVLMTERGGPAIVGHTWWGIAYDDANARLLFMNTWPANHDKVVAALGGDPALRYRGAPLWSFRPAGAEWEPIITQSASPRAPVGGMLEYVKDLGGVIWHSNHWQMQATWLYRSADNVWVKIADASTQADFRTASPLQEQVGYFDPKRKILVAHRAGRSSHFDIATRQWRIVADVPEDSGAAPSGHDARSPFYYDPKTGHGLLVDFRSHTLWAYDPDKHAWTRLDPGGDPMPKGNRRVAYLDPERNVLVVIDNTEVWAYRYR